MPSLLQELEAGRLAYREDIKRLWRARRSMPICMNDLWEFAEGCPCDKTANRLRRRGGELEAVTRRIVEEAQAGTADDE